MVEEVESPVRTTQSYFGLKEPVMTGLREQTYKLWLIATCLKMSLFSTYCSVWLDRLVRRKVEIADFQSLYTTTVTYSQLKHMATRYGSRLPSIIRHVSNCDPGDAE